MTTTGALLVLFIGLKIAGVLTWSWWWVLSPLWAAFLGRVVVETIKEMKKTPNKSN